MGKESRRGCYCQLWRLPSLFLAPPTSHRPPPALSRPCPLVLLLLMPAFSSRSSTLYYHTGDEGDGLGGLVKKKASTSVSKGLFGDDDGDDLHAHATQCARTLQYGMVDFRDGAIRIRSAVRSVGGCRRLLCADVASAWVPSPPPPCLGMCPGVSRGRNKLAEVNQSRGESRNEGLNTCKFVWRCPHVAGMGCGRVGCCVASKFGFFFL